MVFVLDNYDSFTYNLVQYLGELGQTLEVRRNDQVTLDEIAALRPSHIVISPGPGRPEAAGVTPALIERFGPAVPILGVCLGHQAIGLVCGGRVVRAPAPMHGKTSTIDHDGTGVFAGLASPIEASRYHSLAVQEDGLPEELEITARSRGDNVIMGLRHRRWPLVGVQFHPESILTGEGRRMLRNFLDGK
jgi:anthranilate synthase/aminodeoxychorismate synthase-like glutamine amidotransferase